MPERAAPQAAWAPLAYNREALHNVMARKIWVLEFLQEWTSADSPADMQRARSTGKKILAVMSPCTTAVLRQGHCIRQHHDRESANVLFVLARKLTEAVRSNFNTLWSVRTGIEASGRRIARNRFREPASLLCACSSPCDRTFSRQASQQVDVDVDGCLWCALCKVRRARAI